MPLQQLCHKRPCSETGNESQPLNDKYKIRKPQVRGGQLYLLADLMGIFQSDHEKNSVVKTSKYSPHNIFLKHYERRREGTALFIKFGSGRESCCILFIYKMYDRIYDFLLCTFLSTYPYFCSSLFSVLF